MTKQELIERGFKYIATQEYGNKVEVWAKFTGYEDMIQYWYYFPEIDQTNPGSVNTISFVSQLCLFSKIKEKLEQDFIDRNIVYDKSCVWKSLCIQKNNSLRIGDIVKVIGKTIDRNNEEKELIPIGTICRVVENCLDDSTIGIVPMDSAFYNGTYWYNVSDVEKGHFEWVKD